MILDVVQMRIFINDFLILQINTFPYFYLKKKMK
jgi:hypothetical protein